MWTPSGAVNVVGSVPERIQLLGHLYDSNTASVIIRLVLNPARNELKRCLQGTHTGVAHNTNHGSAPCLL